MAVTVVDLESVVRGEHDENVLRKDFTPSEAVSIGEALEPMEREAAKERMVAAHSSENFTGLERGNAVDKVASAVGMSRPTYEKAKEVGGNLLPIGNILPTNEAQARPLARLEPDAQREALDSAPRICYTVSARAIHKTSLIDTGIHPVGSVALAK